MFIQITKRVTETTSTITGSYNGKTFGVTFSEEKYKAMKELEAESLKATSNEELQNIFAKFEALTKESYKELAETASEYLFVNPLKNQFFLKLGDKVINKPMPKALADRILKAIDDNTEVLPLIKAWIRFLRNPNFSPQKAMFFANYINQEYLDKDLRNQLMEEQGLSLEVATELATRTQTPITMEGLLCTYKVSTELTEKWALDENGNRKRVPRYEATIDENTGIVSYSTPAFIEDRVFEPAVMSTNGDEFNCISPDGEIVKGHIIRVGHRHTLDSWDQVNCNDFTSGVKGLHVGNLDYIRGFQHEGTITHNVFVCPSMIGAFTDDGSGAIRTKEYFVHSSFGGVNRTIYHSSDYGKVTDAVYEEWLAEAVKKWGESSDTIMADMGEAHAIKEGI